MKNAVFWNVYDTPIGLVTLACNHTGLTHLLFHDKGDAFVLGEHKETPLLKETHQQLMEYFQGKRTDFSIPLEPDGTTFQRKVWDVLCTIPYGETMYYSQVAALAGNPKASRAAGMANHNNPISILIPCHRVIGKNGSLTGYGGGLPIKKFLLELEQR